VADLTSGIKEHRSPAIAACVGPTFVADGSIKKGAFTVLQVRIET
jgi:hypothetical protein